MIRLDFVDKPTLCAFTIIILSSMGPFPKVMPILL